ncbi:NYN domain-containing protein [Candidatus Uhrbacteria bacterium]|nr:NYN domain-containing protein [Candidatus Uhrbacteria bacterium]
MLSGTVRGHYTHDKDGRNVLVFKEKGVDVGLAVDMVSAACNKNLKTAIMASSDSDLQPAIRELNKRGVECIYLGFELQPNKGLTYTTKRTILIRNSEVLQFAQQRLV